MLMMGNLIDRRSFAVILVGLLLCVVLAGAASAHSARKNSGPTTTCVVQQISTASKALKISDVIVKMMGRTRLFDNEGNPIKPSDINPMGSREGTDDVEYWVRRSSRDGVNELTRLNVIDAPSP